MSIETWGGTLEACGLETRVRARVQDDYFWVLGFHFTPLLFGAEHGASSEAGLTSGGLAQEGGASIAHDDGLRVAVAEKEEDKMGSVRR